MVNANPRECVFSTRDPTPPTANGEPTPPTATLKKIPIGKGDDIQAETEQSDIQFQIEGLLATTSQIKSLKLAKPWVPKLGLKQSDRETLLSHTTWISDDTINAVQKLLKKANPPVPGLYT